MRRRRHREPRLGAAPSVLELTKAFPADRAAEGWIASIRWPSGPVCPHCRATNIQSGAKHPNMSYRCRQCRRFFSVRTGTVLQHSKLRARKWVLATHMMTAGIEGWPVAELHRHLGLSRNSAWHLAHRIRETWDRGNQDVGAAGARAGNPRGDQAAGDVGKAGDARKDPKRPDGLDSVAEGVAR